MADAKTLHWIFSAPVGITISLFGLFGNILSIIIWKNILKRNLAGNRSTAFYLLALCFADAGLLLLFLFTDSLPAMFPDILKTKHFCTFFSYFGFPFFFFFIAASIWLVVGVTVNRFLMVAFPIKARTWCSKVRALIGIFAILICCFIINVPHFFNFRPQEVNGTYSSAPTEYSTSGGAQRYEFWVHCMFLVLAPWGSVAFFNAGIIYSVLKRGKSKAKQNSFSSDRSSQDKQMTAMLLSVTFTFLLLLAWQCITQCFFMLQFGKTTGQWEIVDKSFAFAKLGVVINSSINFLLYCITGSSFRKELHLLFLSVRRPPRSSSTSASTTNTGTKISVDSTAISKSTRL